MEEQTGRERNQQTSRPADSAVDSTSTGQSVNHVGRKSVYLAAINLIDRQ